jgi:signal recognition particle receptor subunit beta
MEVHLFVILIVLTAIIAVSLVFLQQNKHKTLICGISGSGKTHLFSILHTTTKPQKDVKFVTSIQENSNEDLIDIPGHQKLRYLFQNHLKETNRIIFCIDSTTLNSKSNQVVEYIIQILTNSKLRKKLKLLIICTKTNSSNIKSIKTLLEAQMYVLI